MASRRRRRPRALRGTVAPAPAQLSFEPPAAVSKDAPQVAEPRMPEPSQERYRVAEAASLLGITPGALRRRAASSAIVLEHSEYGEAFVTRAELARHVAEYTPSGGGRPSVASEEIVARIEGLRASGLSYARVAALLTLEGVPTAHGAERWWPSSVRAVIMRRASGNARTTE